MNWCFSFSFFFLIKLKSRNNIVLYDRIQRACTERRGRFIAVAVFFLVFLLENPFRRPRAGTAWPRLIERQSRGPSRRVRQRSCDVITRTLRRTRTDGLTCRRRRRCQSKLYYTSVVRRRAVIKRLRFPSGRGAGFPPPPARLFTASRHREE